MVMKWFKTSLCIVRVRKLPSLPTDLTEHSFLFYWTHYACIENALMKATLVLTAILPLYVLITFTDFNFPTFQYGGLGTDNSRPLRSLNTVSLWWISHTKAIKNRHQFRSHIVFLLFLALNSSPHFHCLPIIPWVLHLSNDSSDIRSNTAVKFAHSVKYMVTLQSAM